MSWDALLNDLQRWLTARDMFRGPARWVVGVSGGPDSTALVHALRAVSQKHDLDWALHVAHLNHGLRPDEADGDEAFVRELAASLQLPCTCERIDVHGLIEREGGSTEEVARRVRYEFLERVALQTASKRVAVGHHADDDAETILHRICRGTGLRGLAGMQPERPIQNGSRITLVRPFLHFPRNRIEEVCRAEGIAYRVDSSNAQPIYTRGKIRNLVMPMLAEQLNPNVGEALIRLAEQARWYSVYLEDAAARTYDALVISESQRRIELNNHALRSKQRIIQAEVVRRTIGQISAGQRDLGFAHIDDVLRLAADLPSGKELHLPAGIVVRKVYDRLVFEARAQQETHEEIAPVFLSCPGQTALPALQASLTAEVCDVSTDKIAELRTNRDPHEEWLDFERLQLPLYVRGRRAGDRFWPLGAPGSKTLGEFFSDEKVDPSLRAQTGVVCDQSGPAWVMPLRIDERVKLRPTSRRALRLVLTRANGG